jgi:hypothetical protein
MERALRYAYCLLVHTVNEFEHTLNILLGDDFIKKLWKTLVSLAVNTALSTPLSYLIKSLLFAG